MVEPVAMRRTIGLFLAGALALTGCGATGATVSDVSSSPGAANASGRNTARPSQTPASTHHGVRPGSPRVLQMRYPAPSLGTDRQVLVVLPVGYDSSRRKYPVIELLHGHPGEPQDLIKAGGLLQAATDSSVAPFIAVVPDGNGPRYGDSWFANIPSQQMGTATGRDLRRWTTATFRTNGSWSYTGLSSGGYGAPYLAMIDSKPVHAVCGLSGYYDASRVPAATPIGSRARDAYSPIKHLDKAAPLTFLAYGNGDPRTGRQGLAYAAALRRTQHRVVVRTYPGRHQWIVWRPAFADCFRTILPASQSTR